MGASDPDHTAAPTSRAMAAGYPSLRLHAGDVVDRTGPERAYLAVRAGRAAWRQQAPHSGCHEDTADHKTRGSPDRRAP